MIDIDKIYTSNNCGDFRVVKYVNYRNVHIEFLSTGYKASFAADKIIRGSVKDRLKPNVYGVGFIGDGDHASGFDGVTRKVYLVWQAMLKRCYDHKFQKTRPNYIGVTVCKEWHNFQNFASWFDDNYVEGFEIEKDIKQRKVKNKVYSPETCIFASHRDNTVEAMAKNYKMIDPFGVIHEIYNMSSFCRNNNLRQNEMSETHSGKRDQHRGWTKA